MSLSGKRFIIDAGHGGRYPGVVYGSRQEKVVTLNMSTILRDKLVAEGATVYMTRTTDKDFGGVDANDDINKRVAYINKTFPGVDVLLSIHVNTPFGKYGPFYQIGGQASKVLAECIAKRYGTGFYEDDFAILRDTNRAGAKSLIEIGQIDQSWLDDPKSLSSTADFIVLGIYDYFNSI
jgi:N-acetylmuramoyl-L-alanine amidase